MPTDRTEDPNVIVWHCQCVVLAFGRYDIRDDFCMSDSQDKALTYFKAKANNDYGGYVAIVVNPLDDLPII